MSGRDKDATRAAIDKAQERRRKARAKPGAAKRKSELLPDLRNPGVRRIPWDDLTPEEQRGIEELKQADERWHRQRAEARKRWPWLGIDHAAAGRELDRAAALEKWGPLPEKRHPKRKKPRKRMGRPPDYQGETIQQIARDYIKNVGLPTTQALLREKVADECERRDITVPENTRFKELISPIYRTASRSLSR
jgi:hypothetical protein